MLSLLIIQTNNVKYKENQKLKISLVKKLGEGQYGIVFLLSNLDVIKIFKNSCLNNTILDESNCLLPTKYENRELNFFFKYIKDKPSKYIVNIYAIGLVKNILQDINIDSYFIILPYCIPFYNIYNICNNPLINMPNGIKFTIAIMKKLLNISRFLEEQYNLINLDFKISNLMFNKEDKNLIILDFSIVKKKSNKKYNFKNKYYIWPFDTDMLLENLPSYSICINGLELLFGKDNIRNIYSDKINYYLNILKKDKELKIYNIFLNGLILKINTPDMIRLIGKISE